MATKTNGAELKAFYADGEFWPNSDDSPLGIFHEETALQVNGQIIDDAEITDLNDTDSVTILSGVVYDENDRSFEMSFEAYFKKWRKKVNTTYLIVSVPNDKTDAIKAAIKAAGGKVA
ncbi:hypothetical protein [Pseudomonas putida]|uniref:Phage tail protein n=1 Tax=Pseudomonas putida TaxID=303 RepID=A0A8I1EC66_PSEPU|nr:hypothetical protein [Pseudomonas putida]MBI6883100.1 hypothetical protein [Pseudomonas putida]